MPYQDYSFIRHYVNNEGEISPLTLDAVKSSSEGKFCYITMILRGCPFSCAFCLNSNKNRIPFYLGRSVDNVIGEIKEAKKMFADKIDEVMFYDDNFFALPMEYIDEFSSKWKEHINLPIHPLNVVAPNFSEESLVKLKRAGATGVIVGIQTISKNGRKVYNNPATKERIAKIAKIMEKYPEMRLIFHIILGNPYENEDDIAENLLFLNSLPKIYELSNYQLIIYPGTRLFDKVKNDPQHQERAREGYYIP